MEKFIYWIKRTLHHSKHCNSLCMLCKYYDECKIDGPVYYQEDTTMKEMYFTIAGCNHYYGSDFMEKGMKVKLVKEPDNEYDNEAIQVKIKGLGKVGYVANSPYTVKGESMSAGRLYDKIGGKAKGKIVFVTDGGVICKVISDGKDKPVMIEEDKVKDENL